MVNHFQNTLSEPNPNRSKESDRIIRHIPHLVSRDQNLALMKVVMLEKVEEVVKGLAKSKAPGQDRFTTELYQATWPIMGTDILEVVEESRRLRKEHPALNSTFLVLISKS